jgi:hypothetical protein
MMQKDAFFNVPCKLLATVLTGPRINTDDVTLSNGLFLTCRGEKYVQYYTFVYNDQYFLCGVFKMQVNPLGWWP